MAAPCIYEHAHDAPILHILTKQLPHSISLLRRIQHGIAHPSSTAKILTTFPPSGPAPGPAVPPPDTPWLAARVDLFRGRETQIIVYSSLESATSIQPLSPVIPTNIKTPNDYVVSTLAADQPALNHARAQLLALLAYVKTHLRPLYLSSLESPSPAPSSPTNNATPLIPAPDPRAFLIGSFHAGLYTLLLRDGVFPSPDADPAFELPIPGLKIHRYDNPPYDKFFFRTAALQQDAASDHVGGGVPLPPGYRYHDRRGRVGVLPSQLDLVQSRTHIPRSRAQLSVMPGVAVYWDGEDGNGRKSDGDAEDEMPIAWAFLGVDGPVATLHVEPGHRGKGLGLALCKETMRRGMDADGVFGAARAGVEGELAGRMGEWVHTEVAQFNQASRRVMKKIGGEVLTTVMWTVIEVVD